MKTLLIGNRVAVVGLTLFLSGLKGFGQGAKAPELPPLPPNFPAESRVRVRPELLPKPPTVVGQSSAATIPPIPPSPGSPLSRIPAPIPSYTPTPPPAQAAVGPTNIDALVFDTEGKEYASQPGEMTAPFTFFLTNISKGDLIIERVQPSCGCTTAKLPPMPWHIAAGTSTNLDISVNLAGKSGLITKSVTIIGNAGVKTLLLKVAIAPPTNAPAPMNDDDRAHNLRTALQNRQAVLQGNCAECHVKPAVGKSGPELYTVACGICHDDKHRAAMVADLGHLNHPTDSDHWRTWITDSKPGSLMPAFGLQHPGGFLSTDQIESLVKHLTASFPSRPQVTGPTVGSGLPKSR